MAYRNYSSTVGFIVDSNGYGDFTTIGAALTAAVSPQNIFIRPGTYTENPALKAGINLVAYEGDGFDGDVIILGKCTFSSAGTVDISGIQLKTNSDFALAVTGSVASIVNCYDCYIYGSGNTAISYTSSSASSSCNCYRCLLDLSTTGITYFVATGAGAMTIRYCILNNAGASSTNSTTSACIVYLDYCQTNGTFATTGTGVFGITYSNINPQAFVANTTALTTAGTGVTDIISSQFATGTASAISIGAGTSINLTNSFINSSNTNAITGAGTIVYDLLTLMNDSAINVTTKTPKNILTGGISFDNGTNTLSNYAIGTFTPTMVGTVAGVTTYTIQVGSYQRVGSFVTISFTVESTAATGTGAVLFGGFPFTVKNVSNENCYGSGICAAIFTWPSLTTNLSFNPLSNSTTSNCFCSGTGTAGGAFQMANASTNWQFSVTYQI